jgi:CheY-like chemotaxis protein
MKILVVDDEDRNREAAVKQLMEKHEVITASSFYEMRKLIKQGEKYDVLMTDLMMPGDEKEGMIPAGLACALLAMQHNIPRIYILSETNHHDYSLIYLLEDILKAGPINVFCGKYSPDHRSRDVKNWSRLLRTRE